MFSPVRGACVSAIALLTAFAAGAAVVPRGLLDHSLCCGIPPSTIDGGSFFDPATDPVFSRRRLPPPSTVMDVPGTTAKDRAAAPATIARAETSLAGPGKVSPAESGETVASAITPAFEALQKPTKVVSGHLRVGFNVLGGFPFELSKSEAAAAATPDATQVADVLARIPAVVRELDGQKVLVSGFMLPMKMEGTLTTEFLLVANSMLCCYGVVPPMNQWMVVRMKKGGVKPQQDVPLAFFGTLRVKPRFDGGALSAIYHLEGDRIHAP